MSDLEQLNQEAERIRMCLAEAGYTRPDLVEVVPSHFSGRLAPCILDDGTVSAEVAYRAFETAGVIERCWPCFEAGHRCAASDHHPDCEGRDEPGWDRL